MAQKGTGKSSEAGRPAEGPASPKPGRPAAAKTSASPASATSPGNDAAGRAPAIDDAQKTVISRRKPDSASSLRPEPSSPMEMGKTLEGVSLEHFQLEEFIGGGGMGAVFRAADTKLGRTVAVKVLSRHQSEDDTLRRFRNEAQSAARLDHENIARVFYVGEDDGWNFIVFEYIEGVNVRDLVEHKGALPLDEAFSYVLQVADALDHAAQRDVVHRDIKPSNIIVTPQGRAKLVDMGLARLHQVESDSEDLTASGVTLGTFDYISPEQARDPRSADVRSDLYSLGCTFFYMLTGAPPFPEGTVLQKLLSHSSDEPPDPRQYRPGLPDEVVAVLHRLLAKAPDRRFQRPDELTGELLLLADRLGIKTAGVTGTVWMTPSKRASSVWERSLPWAAALFVLFVGVAWLEFASGKPDNASIQQTFDLQPQFAPAPAPEEAPAVGAAENRRDEPPAMPPENGGSASSASNPRPPDPASPSDVATTGAANAQPSTGADEPDEPRPSAPGGRVFTESSGDAEGRAIAATFGLNPVSGSLESASETSAGLTLAAGSTSVTSEPTPPPQPPELLIVGPAEGDYPSNAKSFESLHEAVAFAASTDGAPNVVELRYSGARESQAVNLSGSNLHIRSGNNHKPVIVFRPRLGALPASGAMIEVRGRSLTMTGVQLRLELPQTPISDTPVLIALKHATGLELNDCVLTVRNLAADGLLAQQGAAFISVTGVHTMEMADPLQPAMSVSTRITLRRCVARGQATLIRAEQAAPFRLDWEQGLLATTERLLEANGAALKPAARDDRFDLVLRHVTAAVGEGLCLTQVEQNAPYQLELFTNFELCIIATGESAAVFEHRGAVNGEDVLADIDDAIKRLKLHGSNNFYPGGETLLRIDPTGNPNDLREYSFDIDDLDRATSERWYQERPAKYSVMWSAASAAARSVDQHTPDDYALTVDPANPAIGANGENGGFDPDLLPSPISEVERSTFDDVQDSAVSSSADL